jgi:SAM-dependent methyltransferase
VSFEVTADAYDRFMGRYSRRLAPEMVAFVGIGRGDRVLDVGSGPGALTEELLRVAGSGNVAAVDPSEPFVAAARERFPGVEVRRATADAVPFGDDTFDAAVAQLVVHFMPDPVAGLAEMTRVTRPGGVVAACVWDFAGDRAPISAFWRAARAARPSVDDESGLPGARAGHLTELFGAAGLRDVEEASLRIEVEHATFEEWWEPFTLRVGPAGAYAAGLAPPELDAIRERCRDSLGEGPFAVTAAAWAARGTA